MGKAHRKSIVREVIERLDGKMAIGESRRNAKIALREENGRTWSVSTGRIHSHKTRATYQEQTIRFAKWVRAEHHIISLAQLDPRADELATAYLEQQLAEKKSPYTLQTERSALRLFFNNRTLASTVKIPRRERSKITRSRGPKQHDRHFQPEHWPELVKFAEACGLRRHELRKLCCRDIGYHKGRLTVHVASGKGGLERYAPVLGGRETDVLAMSEGRDPDALVFARIPKHFDVHDLRRQYAQSLYLQYAAGRTLPPSQGRLKRKDYDRAAAECVSEALGHRRVDVVLRHYMR
jgi:integrase